MFIQTSINSTWQMSKKNPAKNPEIVKLQQKLSPVRKEKLPR
jgi:hypothetical protein